LLVLIWPGLILFLPAGDRKSPKKIATSLEAIFNHALLALAFFSRRQDRELLDAISRGLLDYPYRALSKAGWSWGLRLSR
jgi:hypothetical protein